MRQAIKELPHMLVLHLKRFEWDFETETRFKKKDRFEFPLHLDMFRYTLEGLAEAEAARSPSVRSSTGICDVIIGFSQRQCAPEGGVGSWPTFGF